MLIFKNRTAPRYRGLVGIGGIGTGIFFRLKGSHTLGRNESRPGELLDVRDYCKLHIVIHYVAKLLGAGTSETAFHVLPIGKVGEDVAGHFVLQQMQEAGIDTRFVGTVKERPTLFSVCFQYPDGSGGNITSTNSAAAELSNQDVEIAAEILASGGKELIALAVPEVPLAVRHHFLALATRTGAFRAASFVSGEIAAARDSGMLGLLDLLTLNESEAAEFAGCSSSEPEPRALIDQCSSLATKTYPQLRIIVSLGKRGAYGIADGTWNFCAAPAVEVASTAGAGDALLGGVISALASGLPFVDAGQRSKRLDEGFLTSALEFGVLLASFKVRSLQTIHPDARLDTLVEFSRELGVRFAPEVLERFCERDQEAGKLAAPNPAAGRGEVFWLDIGSTQV